MSHLRPDNTNVPTSAKAPLNSLVPPQEEKVPVEIEGKPLARRGADFIREKASQLPLDLMPDADPTRDKAVADSVRGGFIDDVGIEENRRVFDVKFGKKEV